MNVQKQTPQFSPNLPDPPTDKEQILAWIASTFLPALRNELTDLRTALRRITTANMAAALLSTTTPLVPNTEFALAHNLSRVPVIYVPNVDTAGAVIYKGATAWTTSLIYLKCNVASVGLVLLVL